MRPVTAQEIDARRPDDCDIFHTAHGSEIRFVSRASRHRHCSGLIARVHHIIRCMNKRLVRPIDHWIDREELLRDQVVAAAD